MSKELEALENIVGFITWPDKSGWPEKYQRAVYKENIDIIKNALKEYELMKNTKIIVADKKISDDDLEKLKNQRMLVEQQCEIKPLFDEETQKKLEALEIIKEKSVDIGFLQYCSCVDTYNKYIVEHAWTKHTKPLAQEEYDLLKEVLL